LLKRRRGYLLLYCETARQQEVRQALEAAGVREIPAIILAGGLGTRLRNVLPGTPKGLAPVRGRPFLAHLLAALANASVRCVTLATGHAADVVETTFGSDFNGMTLSYSREDRPLGTGGALRRAAAGLDADLVLALNGDSHVACDLPGFLDWHRGHGLPGSLVLARVADAGRFGTVKVDEQSVIRAFEEKRGVAEPGWIIAGVYLLTRELLLGLPKGESSLERDGFPRWLAGGLGGYRTEAPFLDIGTPESLAEAEAFFGGLRTKP
jgi:D-glycero-alpha-D-manno-heptose 1-phosphate guanylyltransferase